MSIELLVGHISPETAYHQTGYPYGFRLRCERLAWIEYKANQGYRFVTMTSNPKRPGLVWNKPKASTYTTLAVMYLDDDGHVQWDSLSAYAELARVEQFQAAYGEALQGEREAAILSGLYKIAQIEAERKQCQARMRELEGQPRIGPGAVITRGGVYMSTGYAFWAKAEEHAFVFPHALSAAGLILACPHALKDATVRVRTSVTALATEKEPQL